MHVPLLEQPPDMAINFFDAGLVLAFIARANMFPIECIRLLSAATGFAMLINFSFIDY